MSPRSRRIAFVLGAMGALGGLTAGAVATEPGAEPPATATPGAPALEAHCAGEARTVVGFDPRTTPRPVPTQAAPTSGARPPMPGAGFGATQPPAPVSQQSGQVAELQARWDASNAEFLRVYRACITEGTAEPAEPKAAD